MNIQDMHILFRLHAQQMGMQSVRNITSAEIDALLNEQIVNKVRTLVASNSSVVFSEDVSKRNTNVNPLNSLTNLIVIREADVTTSSSSSHNIEFAIGGLMYHTSISVMYSSDSTKYKCRLVDSDDFDKIELDYCSKASYDYPTACISSNTNGYVLSVNTGDKKSISKIIYKYIKYPSVVKYSENVNDRIDCDLQEYLHEEVVTLAAQTYINNINNTYKK